MTTVAVRPLTNNFGHEVLDFDIASANESQLRELDELYRRNSLLVVRRQHLSPEQLEMFAARFGDIIPQSAQEQALPGLPGYRGICFISNKDADGRPYEREVGRWWHTDGTTLKTPGLTTILYGIHTPPEGVDTLFADACEAFNSLPAEKQAELEGVQVVHSLAYLLERAANHRPNVLTPEERAAMPDVLHPMVLTNPVNGCKAFYLTAGSARGVVGMSDEDGRQFVKDWIAYATQEQFVYRHRWQPGDVLIWNDASTLHAATDYDGTKYDRLLYRCWVTPPAQPEGWAALEEPMKVAVGLAWEAYVRGTAGVGAALTDVQGRIVATGRNRILDTDAPPGRLRSTGIAHAEMDILAQLPLGDYRDHTLWTSLEPCVLCTAAMVMSNIGNVVFSGRDPLCDGLVRLPEFNAHAARHWPVYQGPFRGPIATFCALLVVLWQIECQPDNDFLRAYESERPQLVALARRLTNDPEFAELKSRPVEAALDRLWSVLDGVA